MLKSQQKKSKTRSSDLGGFAVDGIHIMEKWAPWLCISPSPPEKPQPTWLSWGQQDSMSPLRRDSVFHYLAHSFLAFILSYNYSSGQTPRTHNNKTKQLQQQQTPPKNKQTANKARKWKRKGSKGSGETEQCICWGKIWSPTRDFWALFSLSFVSLSASPSVK